MIQSDALRAPGLRHGFFTRQGGHSQGIFSSLNCGYGSGDAREAVEKNRGVVAAAMAVRPERLLSAWQVHSAEAEVVSGPWQDEIRPRVDALVTRERGLALGVLTADCGPVLFADARAGVGGAAHAGWKGALTGITTGTLDTMEQMGARRADVTAVIGPMISQAAYEVGPEFPQRFLDHDNGNRRRHRYLEAGGLKDHRSVAENLLNSHETARCWTCPITRSSKGMPSV